jgi:SRSO17 transposase
VPPSTSRRALVAGVKARWIREQTHQQFKGELVLSHVEGRCWTGLHRHALMTCVAFAWLQHLPPVAQQRKDEGRNMLRQVPGPPPSPSLPAV